MNGITTRIRRAGLPAFVLAAIGTPLAALAAQDDAPRIVLAADFASPSAQALTDEIVVGSATPADAEFEASFARFDVAPPQPEAMGKAVDLATFDPPVEAEPETWRSGVASYYGSRFQGRRTANGERFDMNALTAAHKTLPFGTRVQVTNPRTGKSVTVRINDRGPYAHGREIDLSRAAASRIGLVARGHGTVDLALLD